MSRNICWDWSASVVRRGKGFLTKILRWSRRRLKNDPVLGTMLCIALVVGCQAQISYPVSQISFAGFCGLSLDQFADMDQESVKKWLEQSFGGISNSYDEGQGVISVRTEGTDKQNVVAILRASHLVQVVRKIKNGPTFGQIVSTFGTPESVYGSRQIYETIPYSIGLDYPKLGVTVYLDKEGSSQELTHNGRLEIQVKEDYQVDLVSCFMPRASMDEVLRNGYPSDPKNIEYNLNRRKPWSGFGAWVALEP